MDKFGKKFLSFDEFLFENAKKEELTSDFQPFVLLVKKIAFKDVENPLGKLIGKTRNYLFKQTPVTPSNAKKLKIPQDVPVLNYTENHELAKEIGKAVPAKNLYNKPEQSELVSDKVLFHKTFDSSPNVPKTVFTKQDAENLKFPVVAKPKNGKSARGIMKFDNKEELTKSKDKFDLYSEGIDIKREFRLFCFQEEMMVLNERIKIKGARDFMKDKDAKTEFFYKDLKVETYGKLAELKKLLNVCRKKVKLDVYSIDFAEDGTGKLWIIEMNSRTGMGVDKMIEVYKYIYKDFYKKEIPANLAKSIKQLSAEWKKAYKENKGDQAVNEKYHYENSEGENSFASYEEWVKGVKTTYPKATLRKGHDSSEATLDNEVVGFWDDLAKSGVVYDLNIVQKESLQECTTVAGKLGEDNFLFKNRDRSFTPENTIVREVKNGTEIVYYTDQTGWVEGMNEHGVGIVSTLLTTQDPKYTRYQPAFTVTDEPKNEEPSKYGPEIMKVLTSAKNAKQALVQLSKSKNLIGSFMVADKENFYELEIGGVGATSRKLEFPIESRNYYVKTNNAAMDHTIGHHDVPYSAKWAISNIRKHQAEIQLQGFTEFQEVFDKMKHQTFDAKSPLNPFRTDDEEHTISQCLLDLKNLTFMFRHDKNTADEFKVESKIDKGKEKIKICVIK